MSVLQFSVSIFCLLRWPARILNSFFDFCFSNAIQLFLFSFYFNVIQPIVFRMQFGYFIFLFGMDSAVSFFVFRMQYSFFVFVFQIRFSCFSFHISNAIQLFCFSFFVFEVPIQFLFFKCHMPFHFMHHKYEDGEFYFSIDL